MLNQLIYDTAQHPSTPITNNMQLLRYCVLDNGPSITYTFELFWGWLILLHYNTTSMQHQNPPQLFFHHQQQHEKLEHLNFPLFSSQFLIHLVSDCLPWLFLPVCITVCRSRLKYTLAIYLVNVESVCYCLSLIIVWCCMCIPLMLPFLSVLGKLILIFTTDLCDCK